MTFKPTTPGSSGGKPHKRPSDSNQQIAKSVRPQLPRDGSAGGLNTALSGKMPAGFTAVWDFGNGPQTKLSPTSKPEKKRII
jgi:hypothetical protein